MKGLQKKIAAKKKNAKQRGLTYTLSPLEHQKILEATHCDYTGIAFTQSGHNSRTLERVDPSIGYESGNVCAVTSKVNLLMEIISNPASCNIKEADMDLYFKLKEEFNAGKYKDKGLQYIVKKEDKPMIQETKEPDIKKEPVVVKGHADVEVSKHYSCMAGQNEDFYVSFATFKRKFVKTTCDWSGTTFSDHNMKRKVFVKKNNDEPWSDANFTVVCKVFKDMVAYDLFTKKEFTKFMEVL